MLKNNFEEIVFRNLRKVSQDAIQDQTDTKELKGAAAKVQADIIDCTIGRLFFP